jgi:hypothetical protein
MTYVYIGLEILNLLALLLVLTALLRRPVRNFLIILCYVLWEVLSNVGLTAYAWLYGGSAAGSASNGPAADLYSHLYWSNDVIVDVFRFVLVIVLIYRASSEGMKRGSIGKILGAIMTVVFILPFLVFPMGPNTWPRGTWFNSTSELLNFGAAIMNLVLWGALLANRKRDPELVAVSIGLGIVVTGTAISYGIRHFLPLESRAVPNLFLMFSQLGGWSIWCWAFWPATKSNPARGSVLASR